MIFLLTAILGNEGMTKPVNKYFGASFIPDHLLWNDFCGILAGVVYLVFVAGILVKSLKKNMNETLHFLIPISIVMATAATEARLGTYVF